MRRGEEYVGKLLIGCDGCSWEEKERKTEAGVDGQHQAQLDREGIIGRRDARPDYLETTTPKHRLHMKVGRNADDLVTDISTQRWSG